jgi:hypothetical protein
MVHIYFLSSQIYSYTLYGTHIFPVQGSADTYIFCPARYIFIHGMVHIYFLSSQIYSYTLYSTHIFSVQDSADTYIFCPRFSSTYIFSVQSSVNIYIFGSTRYTWIHYTVNIYSLSNIWYKYILGPVHKRTRKLFLTENLIEVWSRGRCVAQVNVGHTHMVKGQLGHVQINQSMDVINRLVERSNSPPLQSQGDRDDAILIRAFFRSNPVWIWPKSASYKQPFTVGQVKTATSPTPMVQLHHGRWV